MQAACVAIGVLTFGHKQRGEADVMKRVSDNDERWLYEDIRKHVTDKDVNNKVQPGVDGSHASTFVCVMSQSAFVTMIIWWLQYFIDAQIRGDDPNEYNLLAAGCNSGWHRASTFGMVLVMCLNRLVWPDVTRRFNAQAFQVQQLWSHGPINALIDTVVDWSKSPFGMMTGGHDQDHNTLFGYSLALQNRQCSDNWNYLLSWVDAFNESAVNSVKAKMGPRPPQTPPPQHEVVGVPPPPPSVASSSSVPQPPPPPTRPHKRTKVDDVEKVVEVEGDHGEDHVANLPWGGKFDPKNWSAILTKLDVSEGAQLQLVLLSQLSEAGLRRANWIVSQVCDGIAKKPTPFVYRACQNERKSIGFEDE